MSSGTQTRTERSERVNFDVVKREFSLTEIMARDLGHGRQGQRMWQCPFHSDSTASLSVFKGGGGIELFRCHSGACAVSGSVVDFVWLRRPDLRDNGAATLAFLNGLMGRAVEALLDEPRGRDPRPHTTEKSEAGGSEIVRPPARRYSMAEVYGRHEQLVGGASFASVRSYATARGWLVPEANLYGGVRPYPVGVGHWPRGFLNQHAAVSIPKLIRTARTALAFGREAEFEAQRELCVGMKLRYEPGILNTLWRRRIAFNSKLPAGHKDWKPDAELEPPRYWCLPGFVSSVPGEVDANEEAEVLVITEGPGKGIRLYHEIHSTELLASALGSRWHVTYEDNAGTWTAASLERRILREPGPGGRSQPRPVSFFDGYKLIILLFDPDEGGRDAANMAEWLAHRQAPRTPVKKVILPDGLDLTDFFDDGYNAYDLRQLIVGTQATRGVDCPNAPPPMNARQRRALAERQQREQPTVAEAVTAAAYDEAA